MKRTILTLMLMLSVSAGVVFAQTIHPEQNKKGKYGYVNASGKKVVDYKYDEATVIQDGIGRVMKDGKWGLVNDAGKIILNPDYAEIGQFINGMARVSKDNKYGYVNKLGKFVIQLKYAFIGTPNENGLIWVADGKKLESAKFGLYQWDKLIIKPEYNRLGVFAETNGTDITNGQCYNLAGGNQIKTNFMKLPKNQSNYYWVVKDGKTGLIADDGTIALSPDSYYVAMPQEDIVAIAKLSSKNFDYNYVLLKNKERRLFIKNNRVARSVDADQQPFYGKFNGGIAANRVNGQYYFIDKTGKVVSDKYTEMITLIGKGYLVKSDGLWGTTDLSGNYLIKPTYVYMGTKSDDDFIFAAQKETNGKFGFVDYKGNVIIPFMYKAAGKFLDGKGYVKTENGWGVVDRKNRPVISPKWADIKYATQQNDKLIWVKDASDSKWHCRNLSNDTPAFRASFDATGSYSYIDDNYVSLVVVSKKYGIINDKGESVVPATFDDADAAYDALSYLYSLGKVKMGTFETFRYKLNHNPDRNGTKLSDKIADDLWDF